jgi:hypothetical protein
MLIDYNYKPYVYNLPVGATEYIPPGKNNKGFIILIGLDDGGNYYHPIVDFFQPNGNTISINTNPSSSSPFVSGSINDMYMQFKLEEPTTVVNSLKTSDLAMIQYYTAPTNAYPSSPFFIPLKYNKLSFTVDVTPTAWLYNTIIITLY